MAVRWVVAAVGVAAVVVQRASGGENNNDSFALPARAARTPPQNGYNDGTTYCEATATEDG